MTEIIIPVKPLAIAKTRLASVLSPDQRADLVLAMLCDVLKVACSLREHNVWVVTSESAAVKLAQQYGAKVITESVVAGYNAAVSTGLSFIDQHYSENRNTAIVPADVPRMTAEDLNRFTVACDSMANKVRLAPAHDGEGTNGVFLSRADLLQPVFGTNSFMRYQEQCRSIDITPDIQVDTSLAFDIDTVLDLKELLNNCDESVTREYLHGLPVIADHLNGTATNTAAPQVARADSCH